jgi:predicted nucleic acid-binding protein
LDRVFLDANILFSAGYSPGSVIASFWDLSDVELLTSRYAVDETRRNLARDCPEQLSFLETLPLGVTIVADYPVVADQTMSHALPEKDVPILSAAIQSRATHLITGDKKHFALLFGTQVQGVTVLRPRIYLKLKSELHDRP